MRRYQRRLTHWSVHSLLAGLLLVALAWNPAGARSSGLQVLIVGGGPSPEHNQVAIERNVHYVSKLLPPDTSRVTLFADGNPAAKTVLYEEQPRQQPPGEHAFALLFGSREEAAPTVQRFRAPSLGRLDGAARRGPVATAFERLRRSAPEPVLLYFTGHGSRARDGNLDNNDFDLWGDRLSVHDLAAHIAALPPEVPVTLVMVQCFSGAFGNLIFAGGDPKSAPVEREIAGFFAATRERTAAGCTPELNEAEYRDFTSYFFAALTGRDRVGRVVTGADYNHDGRVGMDEAYAYTLSHDASIDVPVCTSDVFLRRVVVSEDSEVFRTPYSAARSWATPAQGAALDELSQTLKLTGENRLGAAYGMLPAGRGRGRPGGEVSTWQANRRFARAQEEVKRSILERWPELRDGEGATDGRNGARASARYAAARAQAVVDLERRSWDGRLHELLAAEEALGQAEEQAYEGELSEARLLRVVRLAKSVILAHRLHESGDTATRERFERLLAAESRSLLPPASSVALQRSAQRSESPATDLLKAPLIAVIDRPGEDARQAIPAHSEECSRSVP
jgi:hypothetical protein